MAPGMARHRGSCVLLAVFKFQAYSYPNARMPPSRIRRPSPPSPSASRGPLRQPSLALGLRVWGGGCELETDASGLVTQQLSQAPHGLCSLAKAPLLSPPLQDKGRFLGSQAGLGLVWDEQKGGFQGPRVRETPALGAGDTWGALRSGCGGRRKTSCPGMSSAQLKPALQGLSQEAPVVSQGQVSSDWGCHQQAWRGPCRGGAEGRRGARKGIQPSQLPQGPAI